MTVFSLSVHRPKRTSGFLTPVSVSLDHFTVSPQRVSVPGEIIDGRWGIRSDSSVPQPTQNEETVPSLTPPLSVTPLSTTPGVSDQVKDPPYISTLVLGGFLGSVVGPTFDFPCVPRSGWITLDLFSPPPVGFRCPQ